MGKPLLLTGEGDASKHDECRDRVSKVVPVDLRGVLHHECAHNDQHRSSRPRRDVTKDRCEEDRNEEPERSGDGRQAGSSTLSDSARRLDEGRAGAGTEEKARRGDAGRVDEECDRASLEITVLDVEHACLLGHRNKSARSVQQVNIEEGDLIVSTAPSKEKATYDCDPGLAIGICAPVHIAGAEFAKTAGGDHILEEVEIAVADSIMRESGDRSGTRPGDDGDKQKWPEKCA